MLNEIIVSFACNDPNNGDQLPTASACHIDDFELQNTLIGGGNVKVSHTAFPERLSTGERGMLFVGHIRVEYYWHKGWYGNWCWDGYSMPAKNALAIVNYLMKLKWWRCEGGECNAFDKFNAKQPLTLEELLIAVGQKQV